MTPQRHVCDWLHNHNTSAVELSGMVGKSAFYVASFLAPSGGGPAAIIVLNKVVDFSDAIMRAAYNKQNLMNKKKRREVDQKAGQLITKRMMAWKAPPHKLSKEVL